MRACASVYGTTALLLESVLYNFRESALYSQNSERNTALSPARYNVPGASFLSELCECTTAYIGSISENGAATNL